MFKKDFLRDRLILILGLITIIMTAANIFFIIFRIDFGGSRLRFRHWLNFEGVSQFYVSSPAYFYLFILLAVIILIFAWLISYKIYNAFKPAAYGSFILAQILLAANFFISDALFRL